MFRKLAAEIEKTGAISIIIINEMWTTQPKKNDIFVSPTDDPNRKDALALVAVNSKGEHHSHIISFSKNKSGKIKFGEETKSSIENDYSLYPILKVWGLIDHS